MSCTVVGIFGVVVVPATIGRHEFNDIKGFVAHDAAGQLASGDITLHHDRVAESPILSKELLGWVKRALAHDQDAETRPLGDRLDDIRRCHRMRLRDIQTVHEH